MPPFIAHVFASLALIGILSRAEAAIMTVSSSADSGACTLRAAVATALTQAGPDEIRFADALNGQTITLTSGEIAIGAQQVMVDTAGLANGITLSGNNASRIFSVPAGGSLELRGLTLRLGGSGGAGGAISNVGTLTATGCTFSECSAEQNLGGAVYNTSSFTATHCTFNGNDAENGGAIGNSGTLILTHCTLSGNTAPGSDGISNNGGLTLTNCIIADNNFPSGKDILNTGTVTRTGANLMRSLQNAGGGTDSGPAAINAAPRLQPLGNYGGPTPTMPPRADSPALDRIASTSLITDQRGLPRVMWGAADIGAVEAGTQADGAWEVREYFKAPASPLQTLNDALALISDVSASVQVSMPPVLNHRDPDDLGGGGFFPGDAPLAVNNLTPQGAVNGDDNDFATTARTFIAITQEGDYTFGFSGSEGGRLRISGATFTSSTRVNAGNPANPAHSGDTLSFPGLTDNAATLGVCSLVPGVYPVEFVTWERAGAAYCEVFAARGAQTSFNSAFRLVGDAAAGGQVGAGVLTPLAPPAVWSQDFEDSAGGFTVSNVNGPFDGPWTLDALHGTWSTAGQGSQVSSVPSTLLTAEPVVMQCDGDAVLVFSHRFSFESGDWDGGQLRLSVNGGPFTLVPGTAFSQGGYTGTVAANSTADIRGQPAFVFDSTGYEVVSFISSTARLGTFNAGDSLRVQFLASYDRDKGRGNPAWELDSVSLTQQCAGPAPGWELTTIRDGAESMAAALAQIYAQWSGTPQTNVFTSQAGTLNFHDPQATGGGHGRTQASFPGDGGGNDDQFAVGTRGLLNVRLAGEYTFCLLADDAARMRIKGSRWWTVRSAGAAQTLVDGFQAGGGEDVFGTVALAAGAHDLEVIYHEGFGSAYMGLWGARGRHTAFDPNVFALVGESGMTLAGAPFVLARQSGVPRPVNDDFAAPAVLNGSTAVWTAGATREAGEPGGAATGATVWWQRQLPAGTYVLDTAGSDFDTVLAVYSGASLTSLLQIAAGDNYGTSSAARVSFTTPGDYFSIQAGGTGGVTGRLRLSLTRATPPAGDAFASATALGSSYSISANGENDAATGEAGEPAHFPGSAANGSVWFAWTAPATGSYRVDTFGSSGDTVLAVYTGNSLAGLVPIASSDNAGGSMQSSVILSTAAGITYRIAVDVRAGTARGGWRLNLTHLATVTGHTLLTGPAPGAPRTFRLSWRSEPWTTYRVERSADLSDWLTVTDCLPSAGSSITLSIPGLPANTSQQYFRVRRE